ncbi:MAG: acyl-CoA dehydrogenase [Nitrospinaceae bacterium]|jgi:alkylation response protein AidB-like acyl-CoA dehydrogenase|nr:acyl-CoA dehydrogenase [Nitrospinaceae bacterium]MBT3435814.1 acyl-CoA dehydrogenase [Nitrospinaceae bacterium]MBT4095056.1 acyl-CoA dehydrogenase [Nitrospinaceae bacterium]MBT4431651.1 acyl-CoA dehydrogenase [Nitrospinaceae bacterium]MBT5366570.1 acyl-CoA dehydrogenase [Nitrospinaceae bacterium]
MHISDENRALQQMARDFSEKEIRPISAERDLIPDPKDTFDWEIIKKGSALGLRTLAVPERFGGPEVDLMGQALVILELARGDGAICKTFSQNWKFSPLLCEIATDEQRERFLPQFMEDDTFLLASGNTEPDAGSDNRYPPSDYPKAGYKMSAVQDGDDWILNGMKHFIANGGVASLYFMATRTAPDVPIKEGTTVFMVPKDTPGFTIGRRHNKIGWRFYQNAELIFEDCRVPDANRLCGVNEGRSFRPEGGSGFNDIELSGNLLGIGQAAYEHAIEHARNRFQGGKIIIEHQAMKLKLADMYMRLEAGRSYYFKVVEDCMKDIEGTSASKQLMKVFATEVAQSVTRDAVEIFGGMGVMKDAPVEKLMRDASIFTHLAAGTVNTLMAAEKLT